MKEVLDYIAQHLVDDPDAVAITEDQTEGGVVLHLSVAPEDVGKVIGRHGRTVNAIRDVLRAAGTTSGGSVRVEITE